MAHDDSFGSVIDPDEVQGVLTGQFYSPRERATQAPADKPTHYKIICISMYTKDLARLDELVAELKANGLTKANRSALIRAALDQVDLSKIPRGM
jgi:hypothetical protein